MDHIPSELSGISLSRKTRAIRIAELRLACPEPPRYQWTLRVIEAIQVHSRKAPVLDWRITGDGHGLTITVRQTTPDRFTQFMAQDLLNRKVGGLCGVRNLNP